MVSIASIGMALCAVAQDDEPLTMRGFNVPNYDDEGVLLSQLFGDLAKIRGEIADITNLKIEFYDEDSTNVAMEVTAPQCTYHQEKSFAESKSDVRISRERMVVTGVGFAWDTDEERLKIFNNAKVILKDMREHVELGEEE